MKDNVKSTAVFSSWNLKQLCSLTKLQYLAFSFMASNVFEHAYQIRLSPLLW